MVVAVEQVEEVNRSRAELQEQLAYDAAHDALTQLPNRARGLGLTRRSLARDRGSGSSTACCSSTSTASSTSTTPWAIAVATRCCAGSRTGCGTSVRGGDVAIRYGGDEFLVLLDSVGDTDTALSVARRLIAAISEPIAWRAPPPASGRASASPSRPAAPPTQPR